MPPRLSRPETGTDEGGLWAMLDREEAKLRRSLFLVQDKPLNDYVNRIACRLAGDHCPDLRVYVVRTPYFNASMAPNGMMQVWTGLLLRMSNEAQLAAVLGHEIGHYLARHSLERLRDAKSRSAFGQFLGIALGAAGAGGAAPLAQLALTAGMFAYEREHEREADRIGLELMAKAGYEPIEASRVWAQLLQEIEAEQDWSGDAGSRSVLFASHPPAEERQQALVERAAQIAPAKAETGKAAYRAAMAPHRWGWLEDELKRRKSGETLALFQRLLQEAPQDGELHYFLGEAYRLRAAEGDRQRALDAYQAAAKQANAPAEVHRSLGMLYQQQGERAAAQEAFRRYLAAKPGAADAEMIQLYLKEGV
ncbi:MAG: M48 family metalloprotease [Pseudomonadota bacterium]